jgi:hypothetical protein
MTTYPQPYATQAKRSPPGVDARYTRYVVKTPLWVMAVRAFQVLIALVIMTLAGFLIHGLALDPVVFALVCVWCPCPLLLLFDLPGARPTF